MSILTDAERKNIPFTMYGGEMLKIKLVDYEKYYEKILAQREKDGMGMIVELKAIRVEKHKELRKTISFVKDPLTSIHYGIPIGIHPDGNIKWQKIILSEFNSFNLRLPDEAYKWFAVRMHHEVVGSPFQTATPLWKVFDADEEAKLQTATALKVGNAISKAAKMPKHLTLNFHRFLGLDLPADPTPKRIKSDLLVYAQLNPVDFLDKYEHPDRALYEIYNTAKVLDIVKYDVEKGFSYKGTFLGNNDLEVIRYLETETVITTSISALIKERDVDSEKFTKE